MSESWRALGLLERTIFTLTMGPGSKSPKPLLKGGEGRGSLQVLRVCARLSSVTLYGMLSGIVSFLHTHTSRFEQDDKVDASGACAGVQPSVHVVVLVVA